MLKRFLAGAIFALLATIHASAADLSHCRTLTVLHPFDSSAASAGIMRLVADKLHRRLGIPVVIDYRPGGMGVPSALALLNAAPNGCDVGVLANIHASGPWLMERSSYDPTKGFVPITQVAQFPNLLVTSDARLRSFGDVLRIAREKPGTINVGTMAPGTSDFLTGLLLKDAGVPVQIVPYVKNAAQMPVDVLNGTLQVGIQNYFAFAGSLQQGKLRPLAVTTYERAPNLPEVPTVREAGLPDLPETKSWIGVFGPPGISSEIVTLLHKEITTILREPAFVAQLEQLGLQAKPSTPQELGSLMASEFKRQGEAIRQGGITAR